MCASAMQNQAAVSKLGAFKFRTRIQPDVAAPGVVYPLKSMVFGRLAPGGGREGALGSFGLVPEWVTDAQGGLKFGRRCYNARKETIFEKPSFRSAIFRRRAVVPVSAFFEFPDREAPLRHRYKISRRDGGAFWLAAIWERHPGYGLESVAVITTTPMGLVADFHSRSPVILDDERMAAWLETSSRPELEGFLVPHESSDYVLEAEPWGDHRQGELF